MASHIRWPKNYVNSIFESALLPQVPSTDFSDHSGRGAASGKDPKKKLQPDDIASVVATLVVQSPQSFISEVLIRPSQKP
jgi:hypothetical protein